MHFLHFVHFGHFRKFLKCTKCTKCHSVFWRKFRNERSDGNEWLTSNEESEMWQCSSGFCSVWTRHEPVISKGLIVTNIINYLKFGNYIRVDSDFILNDNLGQFGCQWLSIFFNKNTPSMRATKINKNQGDILFLL